MSVSWSDFDTDTVTITRRVPAGAVQNITTVYSGPGDMQYNPGDITYDPAGVVVQFDALCMIDPDGSGNLPAVKPGDFLQVSGGDGFTVKTVIPNAFTPAHLELKLKRGAIPYSGSGHK